MIIEEYDNIDADFRNEYVSNLLNESDIICTNPPFSLFREFIKWINPDEKKFIILGNKNAVALKDVFPAIKANKIWLGITQPSEFNTPNGLSKQVKGLVRWFTNIQHMHRNMPMPLLSTAIHENNGVVYQKYDNYDAIEVPKVKWLPSDYTGVMGVPISFLDKYNPEQFELVGMFKGTAVLAKKAVYARILIKNK